MRFLNRIERLLLILGLLLIAVFVAGHVHRAISSWAQLKRFQDLQAKSAAASLGLQPGGRFKLNFSLWSERRIAAYEQSLAGHFDPPLAVLRISKVQLEVPVLEGTNELVLNRGVGHIAGTVGPGEEGNIGIAGHRDGFFRVLKDVVPGDTIELVMPSRTDSYVVDETVLVRPDDVSVLRPRAVSSLTLVTCYPFYYVGSAPQRYIVHAALTTSEAPRLHANKRPKPEIAGPDHAPNEIVSRQKNH